MDGASLADSGVAFQITGDELECWTKCADQFWGWHEAWLRELDYWITMSEKVGMEWLIHEGMSDGQKTDYYKWVALTGVVCNWCNVLCFQHWSRKIMKPYQMSLYGCTMTVLLRHLELMIQGILYICTFVIQLQLQVNRLFTLWAFNVHICPSVHPSIKSIFETGSGD